MVGLKNNNKCTDASHHHKISAQLKQAQVIPLLIKAGMQILVFKCIINQHLPYITMVPDTAGHAYSGGAGCTNYFYLLQNVLFLYQSQLKDKKCGVKFCIVFS